MIKDKVIEKIKKKLADLQANTQPDQSLEKVLRIIINEEKFPASPSPNIKYNSVACTIINKDEASKAYNDLTGQLPQRSSSGNQYLLIGYHYGGNTITAKTIKNRLADTITSA